MAKYRDSLKIIKIDQSTPQGSLGKEGPTQQVYTVEPKRVTEPLGQLPRRMSLLTPVGAHHLFEYGRQISNSIQSEAEQLKKEDIAKGFINFIEVEDSGMSDLNQPNLTQS